MPKPSTRSALFTVFATALGLSLAIFNGEKYPPFTWITRLQIALFGQAAMQITLLFGLILILAAVLIPVAIYRKLRYGTWSMRVVQPPTATPTLSDSAPPGPPLPPPVAGASPTSSRQEILSPWLHSFGWLTTVGLIFFGMGLYGWYGGYVNREKVHCTAESIYAGVKPASKWVSVRATPQPDLLIATEERHATWLYIPLVPEDWREAQGISLVMRVRDSNMSPAARRAQPADFEGMLEGSDLPAFVEDEFARNSVQLNSHYQLLGTSHTPESESSAARFFVPAGGVVLLISAGGLIRRWRQARQSAAPAPAGRPAVLRVKRILGTPDPKP